MLSTCIKFKKCMLCRPVDFRGPDPQRPMQSAGSLDGDALHRYFPLVTAP